MEAQRAAVAEALRHATNRYQAGYSPYLEQLDAQRSLLNTDLSLVQLRTDQLNAVVSLYKALGGGWGGIRSEEHTSELQSLIRISYAVFCLKKKLKLYYNNLPHKETTRMTIIHSQRLRHTTPSTNRFFSFIHTIH